MFKRFICSVLCVLISCSCLIQASAVDENAISTRTSSINTCNTYLKITNGTATCDTFAIVASTATKVVVTMTLQQKTLFWWSTEQTWTSTQYSTSISLTKTATVSSDTYRVKTVFEVYTGSDVETYTIYSSEVSC